MNSKIHPNNQPLKIKKNNKLKFLIGSFLCLFVNISNGQVTFEWAKNMGGPGTSSDVGHSIAVDHLGNVYTTGKFAGTADFDPNAGISNLTSVGPNSDVFIQKLDAQGNLIWAKSMGGTQQDAGVAITVDDLGNVYTTGNFKGTVDFDPNAGISNLTAFTPSTDIFIQKLDAQGNFVWAKSMGGSNYDSGSSITVDASGNVYTTGVFQETTDFDPNAGISNLVAVGYWDIFIQKLDAQGNLVWAKSMGGSDQDIGNSITLDGLGNLYTLGFFTGTVDFDPNAGISNLTAVGASDVFIQKIDTQGNLIWAKSMGGINGDRGFSLAVDHDGYILNTGIFTGTVDFDPNAGISNLTAVGSSVNTFIQKLDGQGNFVWAKNVVGSSTGAIDVDNLGNVYTCGNFLGTADLDPNTGVSNLTSVGVSVNTFIQKLDGQGNFVWAKNMGNLVYDMAVDDWGNIYSTGAFQGVVDFDPNATTNNLTAVGSWDIFVHKLGQDRIIGGVYNDFNQNCVQENNEIGLLNRILLINPGNIVTTTDANGIWSLDSLPIGNYAVTIDTSGNWLPTCPTTQLFTVTNPDSIIEIPPFGFTSTAPCSEPDISIHAPFLRPGFSNQLIYVQACNENIGTGTIDSAYVIIELDSLLTVQASSMPYTNLGNNQYKVYIDTLFPGFCANLSFSCSLSTAAILGQSLCMMATLYPIDSCSLDTIPNPFPTGINPCFTPYDGSHLFIRPACNNDTVSFMITNTGDYDMTCYSQVRLYIDGQFISMDSIQLTSGNTAIFDYLGDGRTWRLEVDQHPLHPGNSQPSATIELCGNPVNWTSNLVNILPMDDANSFIDIFCGVIRGSYDPNDKTGYPLGVGSTYDIVPNQALEYLIRFQNTGTDTAFTVVIRDTLSTDLNIASVLSGVSSHHYEFKMYGPRILEWTFNNIMLPDSNVNEQNSHGFIKFKVNQIPNLANGTVIQNSAAIYFDFNAPIITNTSWHTIHDNVFTIAVDKIVAKEMNVKIYPNPTTGWLSIDKGVNEEISILIFDNLGRILISKTSNTPIEAINLSNFAAGIYYLSINNGAQTTTQKIIKR